MLVGLAVVCSLLDWNRTDGAQSSTRQNQRIDFDRQIRPILSENCFTCHGPDDRQRKAEMRLDTREGAFHDPEVLSAGQPKKSKLLERISSSDPKHKMPPPRTGKSLKPEQIALIREWLGQGANWSEHWAFVPPSRTLLPEVKDTCWSRNAIDRFILARLEREGLVPSLEANRVALIRRLTLDLTGLPPTPGDVDAFLADTGPAAYDRLVDRLLGSARFGERMALDWLDAARFADTHGYHIDSGRDMTRWREWVIQAFNQNMPFDRFTIEQLAGDLLPNATVEQRLASGFNRNHMINFEGGAIPEEYHTAYIVDRVNTTSTVWLGLTVGCAQCHDHKFDPISQREYYQIFAFFHQVPEKGLDGAKGNAEPVMRVPTREQSGHLNALIERIRLLEQKVQQKKNPEQAKAVAAELASAKREQTELEKQIPSTMVMQEMSKPRETFVLVRGQYDKKGEKVLPGMPLRLNPLPPSAPPNRLGLARWLVDPTQPLTARVIVNRYWQLYFGTGLVKTAEDFGSQGEYPTHPELLDWLATEFQRSGWDIKHMQRLIVTSATYRQASTVRLDLLQRDPENRLLARASRLRLPAEFIRDQALAASGLFYGIIGGKSVSPYQPPGLWEELASRADGKNWTAQSYEQSHGHDLYRRTMYTFWKRTSPPPTLSTFDAPDRETCTVRRSRTNTPLQALILMNDPTYVEASRKLAERVLREAQTDEDRLILAFRLVVARFPEARERPVLAKILQDYRSKYGRDREAARKLLRVGEAALDDKLDVAELAAWTTVASVILNLDEAVTRG